MIALMGVVWIIRSVVEVAKFSMVDREKLQSFEKWFRSKKSFACVLSRNMLTALRKAVSFIRSPFNVIANAKSIKIR